MSFMSFTSLGVANCPLIIVENSGKINCEVGG